MTTFNLMITQEIVDLILNESSRRDEGCANDIMIQPSDSIATSIISTMIDALSEEKMDVANLTEGSVEIWIDTITPMVEN